ncbi:DUF397 domain-containing protein [Streptomyces sp. NPDC059781]|uniref:DUF397 domain-containing protein n=1 Tax=unclassified Streptomyces TaxID=2593676 RepID=UPI00364727C8
MKPDSRTDLNYLRWRKSSYSNGTGGECLEVADNLPGLVPVRDSKDPRGSVLLFPADAWSRFVEALGGHRTAGRHVSL